MKIYSSKDEKNIEIRYKLKSGSSSISYRTKDDMVLKKFLYNRIYQSVLKFHDYEFLEYLESLDILGDDIFVPIEKIFTKRGNMVSSYEYPYQYGNTINELAPRTDMNKLIMALEEFYKRLDNYENFCLGDMHYRNVLYTGDFKIIDLDLCRFVDVDVRKRNRHLLNDAIFRGLFDLKVLDRVIISHPYIKKLYRSLINDEIDIIEFLKEYRSFISNAYGKCLYLKHYRKGIIYGKDNKYR